MVHEHAIRALDQNTLDTEFDAEDIMTNCRGDPRGEAPPAYEGFGEALDSLQEAGLATTVAKLRARLMTKAFGYGDDREKA